MKNNLPDLSTWHRVPIGGVIPKGTPYAYAYVGGVTVKMDGSPYDITVRDGDNPCYTEKPILPPLPTEEGATILAASEGCIPYILLTRVDGRWLNRYGVEWSAEQIRAWAHVTLGETVVMP